MDAFSVSAIASSATAVLLATARQIGTRILDLAGEDVSKSSVSAGRRLAISLFGRLRGEPAGHALEEPVERATLALSQDPDNAKLQQRLTILLEELLENSPGHLAAVQRVLAQSQVVNGQAGIGGDAIQLNDTHISGHGNTFAIGPNAIGTQINNTIRTGPTPQELTATGRRLLDLRHGDRAAVSLGRRLAEAAPDAESLFLAGLACCRGARPTLTTMQRAEEALSLISAAEAEQPRGVHALAQAIIAEDFFERRGLRRRPSSVEHTARALSLGVGRAEFDELMRRFGLTEHLNCTWAVESHL